MKENTRRLKQKELQEKLKEGRAYIHSNRQNIRVYKLDIRNGYIITVAVEPEIDKERPELTNLTVSYCIKAPADSYSVRVARGYCGYRLKTRSKECFSSVLPSILWDIKPAINNIMNPTVKAHLGLLASKMPRKVRNSFELYGWYRTN